MNNLSPIVLFVYNRSGHTKKTVEALQNNTLAMESILYVYSDAPKNQDASDDVESVRSYIHTIDGFKEVHIIEREKNYGLANSIIDGVTNVINKHERVIVLEDDLLTSPYFLQYMNDALNLYKDEKKVMSISAYMYPIESGLKETFFTYFTSCWGWGTWKEDWLQFERNPKLLMKTMSSKDIKKFNLEGADNIWRQVKLNVSGQIYTWAVFWYATVFKKEGLVLHPSFSMTMNIGHDGSGVHCGDDLNYNPIMCNKQVEYFEANIVNNHLAVEKIKEFLLKHKVPLWNRVMSKLRRTWNKI